MNKTIYKVVTITSKKVLGTFSTRKEASMLLRGYEIAQEIARNLWYDGDMDYNAYQAFEYAIIDVELEEVSENE